MNSKSSFQGSTLHLIMVLLLYYWLSVCCYFTHPTCGLPTDQSHYSKIKCIGEEREALIQFKNSVHYDYDSAPLWNDTEHYDCCKWYGVGCNNRTGHVISLNLEGFYWGGELSPLNKLKHLEFLDLSYNYFLRWPISLGSFVNLKHLDLSVNLFNGSLPSLIGNMHSLTHLDLSHNIFEGAIPSVIGNMHSLSYLDLSHNHLVGSIIPDVIGNLKSLKHLSLAGNSLTGPIPDSLAYLHHLQTLDLSFNQLEGIIPLGLGELQSLISLDLSSNNLSGRVPSKLQKFGVYSFQYNSGICGKPLMGLCHSDDIVNLGLYVSVGVGFYLGFWVVCGTLALKNTWRHALFQFFDDILNKIYVTIAIYISRFKRNSSNNF